MKKLTLNAESLNVQTFATQHAPDGLRGTVCANKTVTFDCNPTGIQYPTCNTCPNQTIEEPGCA